MKLQKIVVVAIGMLCAGVAAAQSGSGLVQRNVNQQERIEQGLQSGQLNSREAGRLEAGEARIDRMEANALKDGSVSKGEAARITRAQDAESRAIYRQKHDAQAGHPNSASSRRLQADVQRNANQQARIKQGIDNGSLTGRETAQLERGQARVNRGEALATADGRVGPAEQRAVQHRENVQSERIYRKKHNGVAP